MNTTQLKEYAQLSQAAYSYFDEGDFLGRGGTDPKVILKLKEPKKGDFTDLESKSFANRYTLLHQYRDAGQSNGFSGALFQDKQSGQLVFSIRGTEFSSGYGELTNDFFLSDVRIGYDGYASPQVVPLYRYFKQLHTVAGASVSYTAGELDNLKAVFVDSYPDAASGEAAWSSYKDSVLAEKGIDAGQGAGKALIASGQQVDVVGHSLGGHLALLMDRLFPTDVRQIVTLNPPGFFDAAEPMLKRFSPGWNDSRITRIEAAGDGVSEIGKTFPGSRLLVGQEDAGAAGAATSNHSSVNGVDGLVLAELLGKLDAHIAADPRLAKGLIDAGANEYAKSYEGVLDGLRRLLLGNAIAPTAFNDGATPSTRESLYNNLDALAKSDVFTSLLGKASVAASGQALGDRARDDFAALVSLLTLSPVSLSAEGGNQALLENALKAAWSPAYADWQADKNLTPTQRDDGAAVYSDRWSADRAAFVDGLMTRNQLDLGSTEPISVPGAQPVHYRDFAAAIELDIGLPDNVVEKRQIQFGGNSNDLIVGKKLEDRLYGGAGNDTVQGQGGTDWLEGNAGADSLDGGDGNDSLFGGTGDDSLNGGSGTDYLYGGAGTDIYTFTSGFGGDCVIDSDGNGRIIVDGVTLAGGKKRADGIYFDSSTGWSYTVSEGDLIICKNGSPDQIRVRNWQSGQLGINLSDANTPVPMTQFAGDFKKKTNGDGSQYIIGSDGNYVNEGVQANAADLITGTANADSIQGLGGDDALLGRGGNDYIEGNDGNDVLQGGLGADTLLGGGGDDIFYGSSNGLLYYPTDTKYKYIPPSTATIAYGFNWARWLDTIDEDGFRVITFDGMSRDEQEGDAGNVIDAGAGMDVIFAGTGNDAVRSGNDSDDVFGMGGSDTLFGDDGGDRIYGDGPSQQVQSGSTNVNYAAPDQHGSDVIDGGAGNDLLIGQGSGDIIYGGPGNDTMYGDDRNNVNTPPDIDGNDYLDGGDGDDQITGGGLNDNIFGGAGNDSLWGDAGAVSSGDRGYLTPQYQGNDFIDAEKGDDYLQGEGGDDTLFGGAGNDFILGDGKQASLPGVNHGKDFLDGEEGDDSLIGAGSDDTLLGGDGNDMLDGDWSIDELDASFHGNDYLDGGDGRDVLRGRGGNDIIFGGNGNDDIYGDFDYEYQSVNGGNDFIDGGAGDDYLNGGIGSDTYAFGYGSGHDVIAGGDYEGDADHVEMRAGVSSETVSIEAGGLNGELLLRLTPTGETLLIQNYFGLIAQADIRFSDGTIWTEDAIVAKTRIGTTSNDTLHGGRSGDDMNGGDGDDTIYGWGGDDVLSGETGADRMIGGKGSDVYKFARGDGRDVVDEDSSGAAAQDLDSIVFAPDIRASDVKVTVDGLNAVLSLSDTDEVVIEDFFHAGASTIERVSFADGTQWNEAYIRTLVTAGSPEADSLQGGAAADVIAGLEGSDTIQGDGGNDELWGNGGGDALYGNDGDDALVGGTGNDTLVGDAGANVLIGGSGADWLYVDGARASGSLLVGGSGDDIFNGQAGYAASDTYLFRRGDGNDTIAYFNPCSYGGGVLVLGPQIAPADVAVSSSGSDLVLTIGSPADSITLQGWLSGPTIQIRTVLFDDGTQWSSTDLGARVSVVGTEGADSLRAFLGHATVMGAGGDDQLIGDASNNLLQGDAGNDSFDGSGGNDTLIGGAGNDVLSGGSGSDFYVFNAGDGVDTIYDATYANGAQPLGQTDTLKLNMLPANIVVTRGGSHNTSLMVGMPNGQQIEVWDWFDQDDTTGTLQITFSDGTVWDANSLRVKTASTTATSGADSLYGGAASESLQGLAGDDLLRGGAGNDTLTGGTGNDRLQGGAGEDTYVFGRGDGQDSIADFDWSDGAATSVDTIKLANGIKAQDVVLTRSDGSAVLKLVNSTDQMSWHESGGKERIERIVFDDGTVWNLAQNPNGTVLGSSGIDTLQAGVYDEVLSGGGGDDILHGGTGNDTLLGGDGNDQLFGDLGGIDRFDGGAGNDSIWAGDRSTIVFGRGYGTDTDYSGNRRRAVEFAAGVAPSDLRLSASSYGTLQITLQGSTDRLSLSSWFSSSLSDTFPCTFTFADGTRWDLSSILSRVSSTGTAGDDYLYGWTTPDTLLGLGGNDFIEGFDGNDSLLGGDGNDSLMGDAGDDTLEGGAGDDTLGGGAGSDTFRFSMGFGKDVINSAVFEGLAEPGDISTNRIVFGTGISIQNIVVTGDGLGGASEGNLYLSVAGTSDRVTLSRWLDPGSSSIDSVSFADGTVWTRADLLSRYYAGSPGGLMLGTSRADSFNGGAGADTLDGGAGDDVLQGQGGADELRGGLGNDTLNGGAGNDSLHGGVGDDTYVFERGSGSDVIMDFDRVNGHDRVVFGAGIAPEDVIVTRDDANIFLTLRGSDDRLILSWYADESLQIEQVSFANGTTWTSAQLAQMADASITRHGSSGADTLIGDARRNLLFGDGGSDTLIGLSGDDLLDGGEGDDRLDGGTGDDSMIGGAGNDVYVVDSADDAVVERSSEGSDTVEAGRSTTLVSNVESLRLTGSAAIDGTGNELDNMLSGNAGANHLWGGVGSDKLSGGAGDDTLAGGAGADQYLYSAGWGHDVIDDLQIYSAAVSGTSLQSEPSSIDEIVFDASVDKTKLKYQIAGNSLVISSDAGDTIVLEGIVSDANLSIERLRFADGSIVTRADMLDLASSVYGTEGNDWLSVSFDGDSRLYGYGGSDVLSGGGGNDRLDGGAGNDTMSGGYGNDTYEVDSTGDVVSESANAGIDTIETTVTLSAIAANVERLVLLGAGNLNGIGNSSGNEILGNAGSNRLDGGSGADTLAGGAGNDIYVVDNTADLVVELAGGGTDAVEASIAWTLGADLENLLLTGTAAINGTGNGLANQITGNAGANRLDGGAGADVLSGGIGNDTYVVDDVADIVVEASGGGTDAVEASVSYALLVEVEKLTLTGSASINATGNALNNTLTGNAGNNRLDGAAGIDTMAGGAGDDTYVVDNASEALTEAANAGTDTIETALSWTLASNFENLTLTGSAAVNGTGNSAANTVLGNAAANRLDGGADADTLKGGAGDDAYVVDNVSDVVVELNAQGTDTVEASTTYSLSAYVEKLVLTGTGNTNGTGNELANTLTGNAGANRLDGGAGADTMTGGAGNDVYVVDNASDQVSEAANGGTDTVESSVTWMLGAEFENLTLTGTSAINGTGNALANTLRGNVGNNVLDGAAGIDTLIGGAGDDVYRVDVAGDVTTENANEGTDTVETALGWTLAANIEKLVLTGSAAVNATGNALNNTLQGNAAANRLDGSAGADTMTGGAGDDTYVVDIAGDVTVESASGGTDAVEAALSWTLSAEIEKLMLTGTGNNNANGNALANTLTGNAGANRLDGLGGADTMIGGAGNDTYVVDNATDVATEAASGGTDTVESSITWTLGAELENLTLTGAAAVNGTGNGLANTIKGNAAANVLDGGAGNDTMIGGAGDDTYAVDSTSDVVTEAASEGTDLVRSALAWTLGANLENLTLIGTSAVNGTGNTLNNVLVGNGAANMLSALAGADTLDGGAGADVLNGSTGADIYVFAKGYGVDTVQDNDSTANVKDAIKLGAGIAQADMTYKKVGNNLEALINGTSDKIVLQDWYLGSQYHVEEFRFADGSVLTDAQIQAKAQSLVSAMSSFAPSSISGGAEASDSRVSLWRESNLAVSSMS